MSDSGFMTEINPADYFDLLTAVRDSGDEYDGGTSVSQTGTA